MALHAHANPHITMLLAGATLEKRQGSECYRKAGEAVFFHAGEPHQNSKTVPGSRNFNIEFAPEFFETYDVKEENIDDAINNNPLAELELLRAYRQSLHPEHFTGDSITTVIFGLLDAGVKVCTRPPGWILQITELLHDRWNEHLGLLALSREIGVHPVTISRYFPRYFGCTLSDYMLKLRVKKTLAMIKNTPYQLTHIAHESGFADQAHFTRAFKQITGFLPKEYRAM